jgi:hypothetical protein
MGQDKERARFKQTIALEYQAVQTRLSLFEDLCPVTIDLIGETFGYPDPELFAIHLNQSGTHSTSYSDPSPRGWTGSPFKHSHASIRWYRSGTMPASMLGLEDPRSIKGLLDGELVALAKAPEVLEISQDSVASSFVHNHLRQRRHPTSFKTVSNIFRQHVVLATDPDLHQETEVFCMWEERATVLTVEAGGTTNGISSPATFITLP